MKILELNSPKIGKRIEKVANTYFSRRVDIRKNPDFIAQSRDLRNAQTELQNKLSRLGWITSEKEQLHGYFSTVYTNLRKNFVLKINDRPDPGYAHFVEVVKKAHNIHFPRISDMRVMEIGDKKYAVYLIEKLEPARIYNMDFAFKLIVNFPDSPLEETFEKFTTKGTVPELLQYDPSLVEALRYVGRNMGTFKNDLHFNNFMMRPSDQAIVIIDPYGGPLKSKEGEK